ncbi:DEAD/DEAH box helicase [Metarhizium robertsii]|uniref:DNA 3'-5' helicase n=2 Tax=Metarhizium robertsii TaxID=568076 RepID=E9FCG4_METRA|nr:DEAD-like helicase [Metarhizium robertsii ARSEF 23]EFY94592.1 DEAD-like helicase [Metarhizium robertsii ARSEF 23]EXU95603.1 DEAD/DEAH box helicase [Metarhizium robertsii]
MRSRASFRRLRRETIDSSRDFVHDAYNTGSMVAIQDLVEKARHASEEVQKGIIRAGLQRHLYPFEPRQKQIDAIWHLVFKKEDLLLAAKTSFGKSVVFQAAPLFCRGGIGLIIIPLDRIGQEQCIKIQRLSGARSVFINGGTDKTDVLAQEIETGVYTHLIMGPEIAAGWFRSIASSPSFKKRVSVVAVDELHLVALWGSGIRPQYAQLSLLRRRLGARIPWFGCSATLDQTTLDTAREMTGFQASCEFFRTSVDRPEIKLIVEAIEPRTTKRFTSLFFVLQNAMTNELPTPEKIPKTVVFIDSRRDIQKCAECLRDWLCRLSAGAIRDRDCREIIRVYHSHTTLNDKDALYNEFSKADSKIRIMVATESLGTGVDLSDVIRVVQYGFPLERLLCVLIQRFGRAARKAGIKGEAIFLVESWAVGDRIASTRAAFSRSQMPPSLRRPSCTSRLAQPCPVEPEVDGDVPDDEFDVVVDVIDVPEEQRGRETERERRTDLYNDCPALYNFVNRSACLRRILMDWLQEGLSDPTSRLPPPGLDECCNVCNPTLMRRVPFPWDIARSLRKPHAGTASVAFYNRLVLWGNNVVNSAHQTAKPELSVRLFTQKSEWVSLSTEYAYIHTAAELEEFVKSNWLRDHSDELFEEFNDIKSYVVKNWPGGSRPRMLETSGPVSVEYQEFYKGPKRRESLEREAPVAIEHPTSREKTARFLRERNEYISTLEGSVARARENAASRSLCSPGRASLERQPVITTEQQSPQAALLERQVPPTTKQTVSKRREPRVRRVSNEVEIPMTPYQGRRASFLREREEFASSLQRIIAKARENSASCSSYPSTPTMVPAPANTPCTSISGLMTSTNVTSSAAISNVFEDSENEVPGVLDGNRLLKRPSSSRGSNG